MPRIDPAEIKNGTDLAPYIDHTLLSPLATTENIEQLCQEAMEYGFFSVCLAPCYVPLARQILSSSPVRVCTVIGFPTGMHKSAIKKFEAKTALDDGADELDMVINLGFAREKKYAEIREEISSLKSLNPKILKVILETCHFGLDEIGELSRQSIKAGADFVKTSTGFAKMGAAADCVNMMRDAVGPKGNVKASGGIRSFEKALEMIEAGANRLGTSSGVAIVKGLKNKNGGY